MSIVYIYMQHIYAGPSGGDPISNLKNKTKMFPNRWISNRLFYTPLLWPIPLGERWGGIPGDNWPARQDKFIYMAPFIAKGHSEYRTCPVPDPCSHTHFLKMVWDPAAGVGRLSGTPAPPELSASQSRVLSDGMRVAIVTNRKQRDDPPARNVWRSTSRAELLSASWLV